MTITIKGKMKDEKYLIVAGFLLCAFCVSAQQSSTNERSNKLQQLNVSLDGTYQIQVLNSRELPIFPMSLLPKIDSLRNQNDTVYLSIKPAERIMILPRRVIDNPAFKKPEGIIHISAE
jgi:hypothetical protein